MKSNAQRKYLFLPEGIDLNEIDVLLKSLLQTPDNVKRKSKDIHIFLHKIIIKMVYNNCKTFNNDGFIQISKEERRRILGKKYVQWIEMLVDAGIIEVAEIELTDKETGELMVVEAYKQGKTCKQYRIKNFTGFKRVEITNDSYILERLKAVSNNYRIDEKEIYKILKGNVDRLFIIDSEEARLNLNDYYQARESLFSGDDFMDMFNSNVFEISIDDYGNRFQAVHARWLKKFRRYLRFRGLENEILFNVDIVNSQPFLYSQISSTLIENLVPECAEALPIILKYENNKDVKKYRRLGKHGILYESIVEGFAKCFMYKIHRGLAKKSFYYANFSPYPNSVQELQKEAKRILKSPSGMYNRIGKINKRKFKILSLYLFQKLFPSIYAINEELKQLNWDHLVESKECVKRWSNPCLLLQRIESAIMVQHVSRTLLEKGVTNFVTIHDSFLVVKKDVAKVKKSIKQVFTKFGLDIPVIQDESTDEEDMYVPTFTGKIAA